MRVETRKREGVRTELQAPAPPSGDGDGEGVAPEVGAVGRHSCQRVQKGHPSLNNEGVRRSRGATRDEAWTEQPPGPGRWGGRAGAGAARYRLHATPPAFTHPPCRVLPRDWFTEQRSRSELPGALLKNRLELTRSRPPGAYIPGQVTQYRQGTSGHPPLGPRLTCWAWQVSPPPRSGLGW